jgi:hypothetical protein
MIKKMNCEDKTLISKEFFRIILTRRGVKDENFDQCLISSSGLKQTKRTAQKIIKRNIVGRRTNTISIIDSTTRKYQPNPLQPNPLRT